MNRYWYQLCMIRGMMRIAWGVLTPALMLVLGLVGPNRLVAQDAADAEHAEHIVARALERAAWAEKQGFAGRYRCEMSRRVRRFDGDGRVTREETREFQVEPVHGVPFARLVTRDDEPLDDAQRAAEDERKRQFAEAVVNGTQSDDDDDEIVFNEELTARYQFQSEGVEPLRGRSAHRLSFRPRPGRLPVRRNLDRALNNASGVLWVDQRTFEVARVEFDLIDRVRMWWGLLGTISDARGSFDRYPVEEEIWAPLQLETFVAARVLFSATRRAELSRWKAFELVAD